ncbi:putative ankyrin repeat protein, partial [Trichoderma atroviride IMI 206040]
MGTRPVHIYAPPSLTSCIDIVNRATAPYHNERPTRGAIISFDFKYPSSIFFVEKETEPKFDLNFTIQIEDEYHGPVEIQAVEVNHFNLDNNIAELLNESKKFPTFEIERLPENRVRAQIHSLDDYCNWGDNNVRFVVLSNVYPSNIDVSISLLTRDGTHQLRGAFTGASRPYMASWPNEEKLHELLSWSAGLGYVELFKAYLDQAPLGLEKEDAFGMTPFSWAAQSGCASVVRVALQQAGSIYARRSTARGPAPLEAAARSKNKDIFESFLKWLKYLESPVAIDKPPEPNEIPEHGSSLADDDIEGEIHSAIRNKQTFTTQRLVEILYKLQGGRDEKKWLANRIVEAAEKGDLYLVQALRSCGAEVNCENEGSVTPLMGAINNKNNTKVAEYLILQGAEDDDDSSALKRAVKTGQHRTIRALLQVKIQMEEGLKKRLQDIASKKQDSTTLMLLRLEKGTEKLAAPKDLDQEVDKLFGATVVEFSEHQSPKFTELTVNALLQESEDLFDLNDKSNFKWFHLPANNMKWVEALMGKIYYEDPSLAYKVLDPKRWIKRQHEGANGSSHARFMMSACHDFQEAFANKKKNAGEKEDRHVVLFVSTMDDWMPYLHWDDEVAMQKRSELLEPPPKTSTSKTAANVPSTSSTTPPLPTTETQNEPHESILRRESMLIEKYLLSELDHDKNSRHLLHVRRTLDQSLYHNLKDTKIRDADQTVRRYQKILNKDKNPDEVVPFTVIMVDQLWLWILLGPSGKAQAVVTCFPSRDWLDVNASSSKILDPQRTTDVLQTTKSYIQQRPDAVKTPYDLAGVIASRCSRALLDHSTDMLDFTEVYENSISYIMNEEVVLFNTFNYLMQTRTGAIEEHQAGNQLKKNASQSKIDSRLAMEIIKKIDTLSSNPEIIEEMKECCREYRKYARLTEIPNENEIKGLKEKLANDEARLTRLLAKFGRFFVLDITREIFLLRQIKDIQDELGMMGKVFAEQKEVIEAMDRIIRAMIRPKLDPNDNRKTRPPNTEINPRRSLINLNPQRERNDSIHNFFFQYRQSNTDGSDLIDESSSIDEDEDSIAYGPLGHPSRDAQKKEDFMKQAQSIIWHVRHQKHNLPLRTVDRFANLVEKMNERAKNANKAVSQLSFSLHHLFLNLTNLVDLKQKQSNMIDTRTTRLQAEESHKMALESEKQSRTLMVFTFVTIFFLPLSFIAAFFAIPVEEFNNITLDFVSMIT